MGGRERIKWADHKEKVDGMGSDMEEEEEAAAKITE